MIGCGALNTWSKSFKRCSTCTLTNSVWSPVSSDVAFSQRWHGIRFSYLNRVSMRSVDVLLRGGFSILCFYPTLRYRFLHRDRFDPRIPCRCPIEISKKIQNQNFLNPPRSGTFIYLVYHSCDFESLGCSRCRESATSDGTGNILIWSIATVS